MGKIIAFSNQKGGTGKTTSVIHTAGVLSDEGYRVLVVDLDPQASLTIGFLKAKALTQLEQTIYSVLLDECELTDVIKATGRERIDIAPANIKLAGAEVSLLNEYDRATILKSALADVKDEYDFILIDCPPSLGVLTVNGLASSYGVVIPMACEYYSLVGVTLLLETLTKLKKRLNPSLKILGVLPTRLDRRTSHSLEIEELTRTKLGRTVNVFDTTIRSSTVFQKASAAAQTITEYAPKHAGASDYRAFVKELINE